MKSQIVILLFNKDYPITGILDELKEWYTVDAETFELTPSIFQKAELKKIAFYTHDTATAVKIVGFCKENDIEPFGVNLLPSVNREAIKREAGDNPFDSRFVCCDSTTTAHMIELNADVHFNPKKQYYAV